MKLPKMMRAAVVVEPGKLELRELSVPEPGDFEALVKIEICGICGTTDRHLVEGKQAHHPGDWYPAVLGHEAVGTVVAVGKHVKTFSLGDRVTRPAAVWPGERRGEYYSAWGGFAEFGIVRDRAALLEAGQEAYRNDYTALRQVVVPKGIDPIDGAEAISLAEVASWMWKLGALGRRSFAIGGTGFVAYTMCALAKLAGAEPVILIGRRDVRLEHGRKCGADVLVNSTKDDVTQLVTEATAGAGVDYFAEASGADEVFSLGLASLRSGGTLAIYGAPDGYKYTLAMKNARGEFNVLLVHAEEHTAFEWVCRLIQHKQIDTEILRSHVWEGLDCLDEALAAQARGEVIKGFIRIQ